MNNEILAIETRIGLLFVEKIGQKELKTIKRELIFSNFLN
jgi:hypothetical protein